MRPMKLELLGFTSFRDKCEIDFTRFDLFAITGQTGAGKTSLLDAMTYALYGKTSRLNKAGRDLISQGAARMSVSLHFRAGGDEYRVSRAIQGPVLTVRLEKREQGKWQAISGSPADIGTRVARIIGLDFDAFTRSVILPQGKFDQFLRGSRKEQRETLSDLLDMRIYQRMVQLANARKNLAAELVAAKQAEVDPAATGEAKAEQERELARLQAEEERAADAVDRWRQALPGALVLREKRKARQAAALELRETQTRLAQAEDAAIQGRQDLDSRRGLAEGVEREMSSLAYDGESHVRLAKLEELALRRRNLAGQLADLESRKSLEEARLRDAETAVQSATQSLDGTAARLREAEERRESAKAAFGELRARHGSADAVEHAAGELEAARSTEDEIPKLREAVTQAETRAAASRAECESAREAVAAGESELESARAAYEHWLARDRAAALRHDLKPGERCPVCEQTVHALPASIDAREVANARRRHREAEAALQGRRERLAALRAQAEALPDRVDVARRRCELREAALQSAAQRAARILGVPADDAITAALLRGLAERIRTAEAAALEAQPAYERAVAAERAASQAAQHAQHEQQLIRGRIGNLAEAAASPRKEIAVLDEALRAAPPLEEISARLRSFASARQKCAALEAARTRYQNELKQAEEAALRCVAGAEALRSAQAKCAAFLESLDREIETLVRQMRGHLPGIEAKDVADEAAQIEGVQAAGQKDLEAAQARAERCRCAIQAIEEKVARNQRLREEIARQQAEESLYRDLATWLNAGNFQQYLMSSAFELLAHEGSRYLRGLSSGRYTFGYDDNEFQVIDKWNGDEARSVNTLSGGESFLASLSLALALAESIGELNFAAGAVVLESLFLDEGFSTLDTESQSRVADALQVLQGGKRLIGVITHVQALADQMPAHIEIERTLSGSRVRPARG